MAYLNLNGINIYYEVKGNPESKNVVAFLNGVMASVSSWDYQVPLFERMGFKIIVHDFKGQLKSDKPTGPYTFMEHANEFKALLDYLQVEKVHVVGTSYGSEVGMKFAIHYPERLHSLTIIDGVSELDEILKSFVSLWFNLADGNDGQKFFNGMLPSIYGEKYLNENKELLSKRAKAFQSIPTEYFEGQKTLYQTFLNDVYMTDQLHLITAPTLVVVGEEDMLKRPKFSKIITDNIKNSEYIKIPDAGHVVIFEKYNELNSALLGFILKNS